MCLLTQYGTDEPHQAVELVGEPHLKEHRGDVRRLHGVAELNAKQYAAVEEQLWERASGRDLTEVQLAQGTRRVGRRGWRRPDQLAMFRVSLEVVGTVTEVARGGRGEASRFGECALPYAATLVSRT